MYVVLACAAAALSLYVSTSSKYNMKPALANYHDSCSEEQSILPSSILMPNTQVPSLPSLRSLARRTMHGRVIFTSICGSAMRNMVRTSFSSWLENKVY